MISHASEIFLYIYIMYFQDFIGFFFFLEKNRKAKIWYQLTIIIQHLKVHFVCACVSLYLYIYIDNYIYLLIICFQLPYYIASLFVCKNPNLSKNVKNHNFNFRIKGILKLTQFVLIGYRNIHFYESKMTKILLVYQILTKLNNSQRDKNPPNYQISSFYITIYISKHFSRA